MKLRWQSLINNDNELLIKEIIHKDEGGGEAVSEWKETELCV